MKPLLSAVVAVALAGAVFWAVVLVPVFINAGDPKWDAPGRAYYGVALFAAGAAVAALPSVRIRWFAVGLAGAVALQVSAKSAPLWVYLVYPVAFLAPTLLG